MRCMHDFSTTCKNCDTWLKLYKVRIHPTTEQLKNNVVLAEKYRQYNMLLDSQCLHEE